MPGWEEVLRNTHWGRLFHAYGVADDTPGHLRNLVSDLAAHRQAALTHLDSAVLHQGTIFSVTPAAVRVLAGLLPEPALRELLDENTPTVTPVIAFLGNVGASLNEVQLPDPAPEPSEAELDELILHLRDDEDGEDDLGWGSPLITTLMCQAVLALRAMTPDVVDALAPFVADDVFAVREAAINTAAQWGAIAPTGASAQALAQILRQRLDGVLNRDERAALVLALGQLGGDVSGWLEDQDEAIRACAALFVADARATSVLIAALTHPAQVNAWFEQRPAFFPMHARFTLLGELIDRNVTLAQLLPAALALIAQSKGGLMANSEWGRILVAAFPAEAAAFKPGKRPPLPARLTHDQHAILQALAANPDVWDARDGNANLARMQVGLPDTREAVAAYLARTPML